MRRATSGNLRSFARLSAAALTCLALACAAARAAEPAVHGAGLPRKPAAHRVILCNDGGTLAAPDAEAPLDVAGLVRSTIAPLQGTMIDTLYWQLGTDPYLATPTSRFSDWYSHNTNVGPRWGAESDKFQNAGEWRVYETTRQLQAQGADPVQVIVNEGHKAGLDVFLSLRFNDAHDSRLPEGLKNPFLSPMKRQHPEWLIAEPGYGNMFTYNFALPEVRAYRLRLIEEAITHYDLDGFDLDFCRYPVLFKKGQAAAGTPLITDMVRQTRAALDARSQQLGRKLYLSVRVPLTPENAKEKGLDVATWIRERLVDFVTVADVQGWNYRLPIEPYVALAQGTNCKILAQNLDCFKEPRPRSAAVLFHEPDYYTTEQFRAVAATHWQAGAQGMFIWNQHFIKFARDDAFDRQSWKEIGDPVGLAHKDKHYLAQPAAKGGLLPFTLDKPGVKAATNVEIADDVAAARGAGVLREATLRLLVEQLTNLDQLDVKLNGVPLAVADAKKRLNYNDCWLDFDVAASLHQGNNALEVAVEKRNPHVGNPLVLRSVEAMVRYQPENSTP